MFEGWDKKWRCDDCDFADFAPAEAKPTACPSCAGPLRHVGHRPQEGGSKGGELALDPKSFVTSIGRRVRSDAEQERIYSRIDAHSRKLYNQNQRSLSKRDGPRMEMVARIPREWALARTRQFGKQYWFEGGTEALKRDGLLWEK